MLRVSIVGARVGQMCAQDRIEHGHRLDEAPSVIVASGVPRCQLDGAQRARHQIAQVARSARSFARAMAWARRSTASLQKTFARCVFTVSGEIPKVRPVCLFD